MFAEQKCSRGHLSRRDKLSALMVLHGARSLQGAVGMWSRLCHPQVSPQDPSRSLCGQGVHEGLAAVSGFMCDSSSVQPRAG